MLTVSNGTSVSLVTPLLYENWQRERARLGFTSKQRNLEEVYVMIRQQLETEIAESRARIAALEQDSKLSAEYKRDQISIERAAVTQRENELVGYDRETKAKS
jgi:hypothetical protein